MVEEYQSAFIAAEKELADLLSRRTELGKQMLDIDKQIISLKCDLTNLARLLGITTGINQLPSEVFLASDSSPRRGLTDVIRFILRSEDGISPIDIRNKMLEMGTTVSEQSSLLVSIHTCLSRLVARKELRCTKVGTRKRVLRLESR